MTVVKSDCMCRPGSQTVTIHDSFFIKEGEKHKNKKSVSGAGLD